MQNAPEHSEPVFARLDPNDGLAQLSISGQDIDVYNHHSCH